MFTYQIIKNDVCGQENFLPTFSFCVYWKRQLESKKSLIFWGDNKKNIIIKLREKIFCENVDIIYLNKSGFHLLQVIQNVEVL